MNSAQILIIDKVGLIGERLYKKLSKGFSVIFINSFKKIPTIPDNNYSHMIVIEDEGAGLEFLPKIITKAKNINAEFIFAQTLSSKSEKQVNKILNLYSSSKVVLYGDIFDSKLINRHESFKSAINKFIYQARKFQKIQIAGDGLDKTYPVFLEDVVDGLVDVVFGVNKNHNLFYLFPQHYTTELSLAHMIQKANPEISVDFVRHVSKKEAISIYPHGKYLLPDKYQLAKKIRSINIQNFINNGKNKISKDEPKKAMHLPLLALWILVLLILSPLLFTLLFSFLGLNTLYFAKGEIKKGNLVNAKSSANLSQTFFYIGKRASDILLIQGKLVGKENNISKIFLEDINLGHELSSSLFKVLDSESYFAKVFGGKSKNPKEDFVNARNNFKQAILEFERIRAEKKIPRPFIKEIENLDPLIRLFSSTSDILPNIFGLDGERTYLVLFQNNMELRPGGGLIDYYGLLKFDKGRIKDFSMNDVSDADKELRGHVEPPYAIRRHLPSAHWYLRDGNFDVNFVKAASSASNFIYAEKGEKVHGVIGLDISFIKNILRFTGPIYIPDYKKTVTDANIYMLIQTLNKKDFLKSVYQEVFSKIFQKNVSYLEIAKVISDSLSEKHLMLVLNDNSQNIFTVNGWSSSLWDDRKEDLNSVNDFLGISEANLGNNKINYFIDRQISQKANIDADGNIIEELNISYKNSSKDLLKGEYKNYLKIILPQNTQVLGISINNEAQTVVDAITDPLIYEAKNFKQPLGLEVERTENDNKTVYGFLVNVPVGEIVSVKVKYNLSKNISSLNSFSYNLKLFKQPGIDEIPYSFSLTHPDNFDIVSGKSSYLEKIVEDKNLILNFSKK